MSHTDHRPARFCKRDINQSEGSVIRIPLDRLVFCDRCLFPSVVSVCPFSCPTGRWVCVTFVVRYLLTFRSLSNVQRHSCEQAPELHRLSMCCNFGGHQDSHLQFHFPLHTPSPRFHYSTDICTTKFSGCRAFARETCFVTWTQVPFVGCPEDTIL